jgi:hypothetical protein
MEEIDIWRATHQMIEMHGIDAGWRAALRADHLLDQGDIKGCNVWKQIVAAINEIQRTAPTNSEYRH